MRKIKLHAIGNDEDFNYYLFDKKNEVIVILNKLFKKILKLGLNFSESYEDKKGNLKERERNFEKEKDSHEGISIIGRPMNIITRKRLHGKSERIDIFYGDKKIFVAIHCPQKLRLKFNEELEKISTMPEPKFSKKLKNISGPYNKEK